MSVSQKISLESFVDQCRSQMIPLNSLFSYFTATPLNESAIKRVLHDPMAALPPAVAKLLPPVAVVLVPFLEEVPRNRGPAKTSSTKGSKNGNERKPVAKSRPEKPDRLVTFKRPARSRQLFSATLVDGGETFVFVSISDEDVADCHYSFYNALSTLISDKLERKSLDGFADLVREELSSGAHGEIDEGSWQLKEELVLRQSNPAKDSPLLRDYLSQALDDTLTLYMHGLCCDIDLEAGPRQLASPNIRRRLNLVRGFLPPPSGFALFPEELDRHH